ncbi:hypothetical protein NKH77_42100 [Streptomyces sp. M19]
MASDAARAEHGDTGRDGSASPDGRCGMVRTPLLTDLAGLSDLTGLAYLAGLTDLTGLAAPRVPYAAAVPPDAPPDAPVTRRSPGGLRAPPGVRVREVAHVGEELLRGLDLRDVAGVGEELEAGAGDRGGQRAPVAGVTTPSLSPQTTSVGTSTAASRARRVGSVIDGSPP